MRKETFMVTISWSRKYQDPPNKVGHKVSLYQQSLWRLPWVFHVGQGKCPALFLELSGRYSTMLHCAQSTLLWAQACGLDLGEWSHPIYIQAISLRSQRHMHTHNRPRLPRSPLLPPLLAQPAMLITQLRRARESEAETERPPDAGEMDSHARLFTPRQAVRESLILAAAAWCWLATPAREVWSERPPDSRPPAALPPPAPCPCSTECFPARCCEGAGWR